MRRVLVAVPILLVLVLGACTKTAVPAAPGPSSSGSGTLPPAASAASGSSASAPSGTVPSVVSEIRPSVVRVDVGAQARGPFGLSGQEQGTGTGILLDSQGHVLTNNHVVTLESNNVASSIQVTLANGKTENAKVVGQDPQTDLAVVQVNAGDLSGTKPAQWADPSSIQVGEPVVAMGYALDLGGEPTVTTGVVSALNRQIQEQQPISGAIQTDAPINEGNSGGPLLDLDARVIGINTAGLTGSEGQPVQGINFAIGVETAKPVATALIAHGKVTRGFMGVGVVNMTSELAQSDNIGVDHGALIRQVNNGSPADQAGLKSGDVIVKVGSYSINNTGDLTIALMNYPPGSTTQVGYYRGKDQHTANIKLAQPPSSS
jgi:serine protease Do